jgi:hypothetical protein
MKGAHFVRKSIAKGGDDDEYNDGGICGPEGGRGINHQHRTGSTDRVWKGNAKSRN